MNCHGMDVVRAREAAFTVIRKAAQIAVNRGTAPERPPASMVALHVWSMTHGIADLFISHDGDSCRLLPRCSQRNCWKPG